MASKKDNWKKNLSALKDRLEKSYEFKTMVNEESSLIDGLVRKKNDYVIFSGYRRNEGKRRFEDVRDSIDTALEEIDCCDSSDATRIYLNTLKSIVKQTRWAKVLESFSSYRLLTE
ncbi:MAG: hypothetical protein ACXAAO_03950 [Candidatus Thorarchaeota archaeon]